MPSVVGEEVAVRPFRIDVPEAELVDLSRRIVAIRWPDKETVSDRSVFPPEIYRSPQSRRTRAFGNLIYFNEVDRGGHFAARGQPQLFPEEVRAAFRSLR